MSQPRAKLAKKLSCKNQNRKLSVKNPKTLIYSTESFLAV
jgi:hypothetical protein